MSRRAARACACRGPPRAASSEATSDASSIVIWGVSARYRSRSRAATRRPRSGCFKQISAVNSSSSSVVGLPSSRSVVSATSRFCRSIARLKIALGCPWAVIDAFLSWGPEQRRELSRAGLRSPTRSPSSGPISERYRQRLLPRSENGTRALLGLLGSPGYGQANRSGHGL